MSEDVPNNQWEDLEHLDPPAQIQKIEDAIRHLALEKTASGQTTVETTGFENRPFTITKVHDGRVLVISRTDPHDTAWLSIHLPIDPEDQQVDPFITHIPIEGLDTTTLTHADPENYIPLVAMLGWDVGL